MQGIHLILTFPERIKPSFPLSVAKALYRTLEGYVGSDVAVDNCHIEIVDSLVEPPRRPYAPVK